MISRHNSTRSDNGISANCNGCNENCPGTEANAITNFCAIFLDAIKICCHYCSTNIGVLPDFGITEIGQMTYNCFGTHSRFFDLNKGTDLNTVVKHSPIT